MAENVNSVISETHAAGYKRSAWLFRPVILLVAAYLMNMIVHEWAHALTAYALDVPFMLFHFGVNVARDRGTITDQAAIGVAGPICSLLLGLISWFFYKRARGSRSELMLLYLTVFGVGTFFGNLMSAAFAGDFSHASLALGFSKPARYVASLIGLLSVCSLHFWAGWQLLKLAPSGSSRFRAMIVMVVLPVVVGTAIVAVASIPIPSAFVLPRLAETSLWVFVVAGALMSRGISSGGARTLRLGWVDAAVLLAPIIATRIMSVGIGFQ